VSAWDARAGADLIFRTIQPIATATLSLTSSDPDGDFKFDRYGIVDIDQPDARVRPETAC
jgi:hypothetical protein